jgi:hypothetical protein
VAVEVAAGVDGSLVGGLGPVDITLTCEQHPEDHLRHRPDPGVTQRKVMGDNAAALYSL